MDRGRKWLAHFNAGKTQLVSFDWSNNTDAIDVEMNGSVFEEKSPASRKIGALIHSLKFLSPGVAQCLYKSIIRPCMEYCCHVWEGAPSFCLELLISY